MLCTALKQWAHTITLLIYASENSKFVNHFHLKPISFSCQIDCRNVLKKIHVKVHVSLQGFPNKFNKSMSARLLIEWWLWHGNSFFFFHTQLWFPASDRDQRFQNDFWCFCEVITWKKHCGRNRIDHGHPSGTEFVFVSLYSTEITRYRSSFLEYKLTWVNIFPHGRPWCILYFFSVIPAPGYC